MRRLADGGAQIQTIMAILGHRNAQMSTTYSHVSDPVLKEQYEKVIVAGSRLARPAAEALLADQLDREIKQAAGDQPVILCAHEMKRLARNAAELMTLAATLKANGIQLQLLTGPLTGIYDPHGMGAMLFAVLAVAAQLDRNYIREKTLEDQQAAAARGHHGGRPKVIDDDMLVFARALKDQAPPVPEIAAKLTIKTGKNVGRSPSVASLYRALAET